MNLIADIGNTVTKIALYDGGQKISINRISDVSCSEMGRILASNKVDKAIVSSVRQLPEFVTDLMLHNIPFVHILSYRSKLPFTIKYETPESLGTDRIAAVAGAFRLYNGEKVLIIDAGTAITYDFLDGINYMGGNISPGISMRFRALNNFTGKLPLIKEVGEYSSPGKSTTEAITAGVMTGIIYEINEYIRTFEEKHPGIKVVISGGDGLMLKERISFKFEYQPDIVVDGLNYILEYNAK